VAIKFVLGGADDTKIEEYIGVTGVALPHVMEVNE
jgi:hypothetical protein